MRWRSHGWFTLHLFSYLLLAVLLLGIVGIPIHAALRGMGRAQVLDAAARSMASLAETLDELCYEMDRNAFLTQSDGKMVPRLLQEDAYYALQAQKELQRICTASSFIEEVALVYDSGLFHGEEKVYAASGIWPRGLYFEDMYRYDQWGAHEMRQNMSLYTRAFLRPLEPVMVKNSERQQFMTYVAPLNRTSANRRGVLLFMIRRETMLDLFERANLPAEAKLLLTDPADAFIYESTETVGPDLAFAAALDPRQARVEWNGIQYHQIVLVSAYNHWQYRLFIPEPAISEMVQPVLLDVMTYLAFALVCAIGLSMILTVFITRPVRRITHEAKRLLPETARHAVSEFDLISDTLAHLEKNYLQASDRLRSQQGVMRMHLLRKLYEGKKEHLADLSALLKEDGIVLDQRFYRVLVLLVDDGKSFERRFDPSMRDLIRLGLVETAEQAALRMGLTPIGCTFDQALHVALLLHADDLSDARMNALGAQILRIAELHFHFSLTIGVSNAIASPHVLHLAYQEALAETDRRFMTGEGCMYFAREALPDPLSPAGWAELEANVLAQLKKEEYDVCRQKIAEYIDQATRCSQPEQARQAMTLLILSLRQALRQLTLPASVPWKEPLDRLLSTRAETITEIQEALEALLDALAQARRQLASSRNSRLVGDAMAYMEANLSNAALNIDLLATHLGVSSGYLSRTFKEQTQVTPMQYLDSLRMKQARSLLKNTQLNIAELLAACGYVDKTNFIRKFRRLYAMTPMGYRHSESAQDE